MATFKLVKFVYGTTKGADLKTNVPTRKVEVIEKGLSWKDAKEKRNKNRELMIVKE